MQYHIIPMTYISRQSLIQNRTEQDFIETNI